MRPQFGTETGRPLWLAFKLKMYGTAHFAHSLGVGYSAAPLPKQLRSMSVLMIPGLSGTAAIPLGNSCASDCVNPSIAHFVAQYGATSGEVDLPQPELKLTITPERRATIAGT